MGRGGKEKRGEIRTPTPFKGTSPVIPRPPDQTLPLKVPLPLNGADLRTQVLGEVRCAESISGSVLSGVMGFGVYFNLLGSQLVRYHQVISRETDYRWTSLFQLHWARREWSLRRPPPRPGRHLAPTGSLASVLSRPENPSLWRRSAFLDSWDGHASLCHLGGRLDLRWSWNKG